MQTLSPRTIRWLEDASWSDDYRWAMAPVLEAELRKRGHEPNDAANAFLSRYGGLAWHGLNPYQPNAGTVMCHTDAITAAEKGFPAWCRPGAEGVESALCPIGEWGYGHYLVAMDAHGRVFGMDDLLVWKEFGSSGEEFLDSQSHDWRWPRPKWPRGTQPRRR